MKQIFVACIDFFNELMILEPVYKKTNLNEDDDEKNVLKIKLQSFNLELNVISRAFNKFRDVFKFFLFDAKIVIVKELNTINQLLTDFFNAYR